MSERLTRVAELLQRETGIVVGAAQHPSLAAALARVDPSMDAERFLAAMSEDLRREQLMSRLVDEVAVQESYFFRHAAELEAVDWRRLLETATESGGDAVRVWVAGCANGEEAYSLGILASQAFGSDRPPVSILGTDVSQAAIDRARAGRYSRRSVSPLPAEAFQRHIERDDDGRYRVGASLGGLARFEVHNLVADPSPPSGEGRFDLITCRNVLIYFDVATGRRVIESLEGALRAGGELILGAADRLTGTTGRLRGLAPAPATVRRRASPRAQAPPQRTAPANRRRPEPAPPHRLEAAHRAADRGDLDLALAISGEVLAADPLDADAYLIHGMAELGLGQVDAAIRSLRRALYVDPSFGLAALNLGRAQEARGDSNAARRAYERALRSPESDRHGGMLDGMGVAGVASARLAGL